MSQNPLSPLRGVLGGHDILVFLGLLGILFLGLRAWGLKRRLGFRVWVFVWAWGFGFSF
jgi:hypothetical protein